MEWLSCIKGAIDYMETNIMTVRSPEEVAESLYVSASYLQRGFQVITGLTLGEYIRNRRLYLAAQRLVYSSDRIIDIAMEFGYETPESFTKAFTRFHGASPSDIRRDRSKIVPFLPLRVSIVIQGGKAMDYTIEKTAAFKVIGFMREFDFETSYKEIPKFWDEIFSQYAQSYINGREPGNDIERALVENRIGEFGVCIDDIGSGGKFRYMIAGRYTGGKTPEGLEVYEIPAAEWVKFKCIGAMPQALQEVNTHIFSEWLPGNREYEVSDKLSIEWYSSGNTQDANYQSAIWIPVKQRNAAPA